MQEKVEATLEQIRPALRTKGGNVELAKIDEGVVMLRFIGVDKLTAVISQAEVIQVFKQQMPEVKKVVFL